MTQDHQVCPHCKSSIPKSANTCSHCGKSVGKSLIAQGIAAILGVGFFVFYIVPIFNGSTEKKEQDKHHVSYQVAGSTASASLTYRNASGGTEQRTVPVPWSLEMQLPSGEFLYVSAQKKNSSGNIRASILVDGHVIQEAESTDEYGIASVSGAVK